MQPAGLLFCHEAHVTVTTQVATMAQISTMPVHVYVHIHTMLFSDDVRTMSPTFDQRAHSGKTTMAECAASRLGTGLAGRLVDRLVGRLASGRFLRQRLLEQAERTVHELVLLCRLYHSAPVPPQCADYAQDVDAVLLE